MSCRVATLSFVASAAFPGVRAEDAVVKLIADALPKSIAGCGCGRDRCFLVSSRSRREGARLRNELTAGFGAPLRSLSAIVSNGMDAPTR